MAGINNTAFQNELPPLPPQPILRTRGYTLG